MAVARPTFNPSRCNGATDVDALRLGGDEDEDITWTPLITCSADFPVELFEQAVSQLIHHPEYNSTLILRSEVMQDSVAGFPDLVPALQDQQPVRNIHRKLLPRRPTRDSAIEQHCTLYAPSNSHLTDAESLHPTVLVLTPLLPPDGVLPYYHPTVTHLALRFIPTTTSPSSEVAAAATLRIEVIPLPGTSLDPGARLYRTCLSLLETLHRYGWGTLTQYKKRVLHDVLVPRETYQDLYLVMRERHKHLINEWREVTDPLKHVFEDIGIATFLMLLWKDTYGPETIPPDPAPIAAPNTPSAQAPAPPDAEPWSRWPRPPGGFIDLGCGNGLLTHILISEGYAGYGFDLRARTSWTHYPQATQSHLLVRALDPTAPTRVLPMKHHQQNLCDPISISQPPDTGNNDDEEEEKEANSPTYNGGGGDSSSSSSSSHGYAEDPDVLIPTGCFLIGNHADELTPWIPPLATRYLASGYLSIPCCAWSFDARFDRSRDVPFCAVDTESLNLGVAVAGSSSSYALYRVWLAALSVHCGWAIEVEMLRIPSTRNWAIVGRRRVGFLEAADRNVEEIIEGVRKRGQFKTRRPEGKAGDH